MKITTSEKFLVRRATLLYLFTNGYTMRIDRQWLDSQPVSVSNLLQ